MNEHPPSHPTVASNDLHGHYPHQRTSVASCGHATDSHGLALPAAAAPVGTVVEHTCPMNPKVRQKGPGSCFICGIAQEAVVVTTQSGKSVELRDMQRRFWVALAFSVPVFVLDMGGHLAGLHHLIDQQTSNWVQLVLAVLVALWVSWPFFMRAWSSIVHRRLNMFTLVALGTGAVWIYSMVGTFALTLFPMTLPNIGQNLVFAFIYNSAGIPLAAGVLYPFFGLLLSPVVAAAAMSLSSLSVVSNALRLRGARLAG